jgi:CMP-N-acetylneuraminic acid synthetase
MIDAACAARRLDRLVVSSDDAEVLAIARDVQPGIALLRPAELATDTSLVVEAVRHALASVESADEPQFDAVAIVQVTSPFTQAEDIDAVIELLEHSGADSAVSVSEVAFDLHPSKFKVLEGDRLLPYFQDEQGRTAAHEWPKVYVRNGSVYATRRQVIDAGRVIGEDCRGHVMPRERSHDINDEMDWLFAEFLWQRRVGATS